MLSSNQGYEMDGEKVVRIKTLYAALQWFKKKFEEENYDNPKFRHFEIVDQIKGNYIMDYTKSYSKDVNKSGGELPDEQLLEKERNRDSSRTERYDIRKFPICWVVAVTVISPLSMKEKRYYYVMKIGKWYSRWANNLYPSAKKHFNKEGFTLNTSVLLHSLRNPQHGLENTTSISTLVIVTEDLDIFYINMDKANRLGGKGLGVVTDKWNQSVVGIPKSEFSDKDVNDYE